MSIVGRVKAILSLVPVLAVSLVITYTIVVVSTVLTLPDKLKDINKRVYSNSINYPVDTERVPKVSKRGVDTAHPGISGVLGKTKLRRERER